MNDSETIPERVKSRLPAFCATMVGGLIAVFVNIPLTSPDDRLGNTGSVAIVSFVAALILGRLWTFLNGDLSERTRKFSRICTALFIVAVSIALLLETAGDLSNTARYVLPLSATVCVAAAALSPFFERSMRGSALIWLGVSLTIGILAIGIILAFLEVGFTEPPSLSLPPPP